MKYTVVAATYAKNGTSTPHVVARVVDSKDIDSAAIQARKRLTTAGHDVHSVIVFPGTFDLKHTKTYRRPE